MGRSSRDSQAVCSGGEVPSINFSGSQVLDLVESRGSQHSVQRARIEEQSKLLVRARNAAGQRIHSHLLNGIKPGSLNGVIEYDAAAFGQGSDKGQRCHCGFCCQIRSDPEPRKEADFVSAKTETLQG